jgi:GTP pyrophosphokinase
VDDVLVRFGKCCNPVPGDEVVGFITRGRGVTVHTADCSFARESDPDRRVAVTWNREKQTALPVKIRVSCHDQKGILAGIAQVIANCEANISSATVQSTLDKKGINLFEVDVTDLDHLNRVISSIMKVSGVIKVERLKS